MRHAQGRILTNRASGRMLEATIGMPHHKKKNPEEFLMQHRYLHRWVNECASCHRKGYKPETPLPEFDNSVVTLAVFRRLFDQLVLDARGLCEQCAQASRAGSRH